MSRHKEDRQKISRFSFLQEYVNSLDLSCGKGRQAGNESRGHLGLELVLRSQDLHRAPLVMTLLLALMVFIAFIGAMVTGKGCC